MEAPGAVRPPVRGHTLKVWRLWALLRELCEKAGVEPFTPHDARRSYASRLLENGFDLAEVQKLMHHESPETTARYDHRERTKLDAKRRSTVLFEEASI